jgi:hypothetical protein
MCVNGMIPTEENQHMNQYTHCNVRFFKLYACYIFCSMPCIIALGIPSIYNVFDFQKYSKNT